MRNALLAILAIAAPAMGFARSVMRCAELDVNNQVMHLQNAGYHIISTRNLTPYAAVCDSIWEIVYE